MLIYTNMSMNMNMNMVMNMYAHTQIAADDYVAIIKTAKQQQLWRYTLSCEGALTRLDTHMCVDTDRHNNKYM